MENMMNFIQGEKTNLEQPVDEMQNFIMALPIRQVKLLETSQTLKQLLQEIAIPERMKLLKTAIRIVAVGEELEFFTALINQVVSMQKKTAIELFEISDMIEFSIVPKELIGELKQVLTVAKAEERGSLFNERKKTYSFNANVFVKHLLQRCYVRSTKDSRLFIYNKNGLYVEISEVKLGKIIRAIMHEGLKDSWKSNKEVEVVRALQREAPIIEEMNLERNFLNVKNGMLNLSTSELVEHSPKYLSTIQIPIYYDSNVTAPKFLKFMQDITLNDDELIAVHQELIGYWLTASTKAEKAVYYYGSGANGKSVLASLVTELAGKENVSSVPLSKFNDQFGLESLIGKSINISAENELGSKAFSTENFKAIVSGDNITINIKYRAAISYRPFSRLVFLVNNLPDSSDVTEGYFRKLIIIPFPRTFKKEERNVDLKDELLEELSGILNWALIGLNRLRDNNYQFSSCKAIDEIQRAYYDEQNPVREFYDAHVVIEKGARTKQSDFFYMYTHWLRNQGIDDKGTKSLQLFWRYFKVILSNENVPMVKKKIKGTIYLDGIKLVGLDQSSTLSDDIIPF